MNLTFELIAIFNSAVTDGQRLLDPVEVNRVAMHAGYLIEPAACTEKVFEAMKFASHNYKSTFYKDFEEVLSRTRFELFVDQMLHYMSTYGTNYRGEAFTLNPSPEAMAYKDLIPVSAVSSHEMFELCLQLVNSGSALKAETLTPVTEYIAAYLLDKDNNEIYSEFDVSTIKNREARCVLYDKLDIIPENPLEFIMTAVYSATGSAMIIKSEDSLFNIFKGACDSYRCLEMFSSQLSDKQKQSLASIYYRFVDVFIMFKKSFRLIASESPKAIEAIKLINYLRHLAPRYKRPFKPDILSQIIENAGEIDLVKKAVEEEKSAFRLVRILGYLQMMAERPEAAQYIIRNGKTYIRSLENRSDSTALALDAQKLIPVLKDEIIARLRKNVEGKRVIFSPDFDLTAPTSEKTFVGNFPFLTSFPLTTSAFIGVYWRNEWGTYDYDLSYIDINSGNKIGWDASFRDPEAEIIFSGDMTTADPEAAEILFFRKSVADGFVYVNRYNGTPGSRFRLFFGKGNPLIHDVKENNSQSVDGDFIPPKEEEWIPGAFFHINKMDVRLEADDVSDDAQQLVGYIMNKRFYFLTLGIGNKIVSAAGNHGYPLAKAMEARCRSAVDLRNLIIEAGAIEVNDPDASFDIDLRERKINRAVIINLFQPRP